MLENHNQMKNALIIFTKVPEPGLVKTRLSQDTILSEIDTAQIAEAMLKDTLILSSEINDVTICLGFHPANNKEFLQSIIKSINSEFYKPINIQFYSQLGDTFDERFSSILKQVIQSGFDNLVVLGADLPYLDPKLIEYAFSKLSELSVPQKVVIGPAGGGGIYLIGLSKHFHPDWIVNNELFGVGIELSRFATFCNHQQIDLILLPPLNDIDIEEDLVSLISYINAFANSNYHEFYHFPKYTSKLIKQLELSIELEPGETRNRRIAKGKRSS